MVDTVSRCLRRMHDVLPMNSPHRGIDCLNLAVDLSTFCLQSVSTSDLAFCSSVLFNKSNGIITFLHSTVGNTEFSDCKTEILKFLKSYVQKIESFVNPYAIDLKDICVKMFSLEQTSKVKVETFPLLIQLLETKLEQAVVDDLELPKLIDKYFNSCMQSSKQQSTVRHWIYTTMGIFAERFPEHMVAHSDRLMSIFVNILKSEMINKKAKKPDMTVIGGCLKGLTSLLVNFTQTVHEGSRYAKDVYSLTRMAITPQVELSRYEVPKAGLNLFSRHAGQLIDLMAQDYQALYDSFYRWCCHQNREVRYAGLAAIDSFLKEVSQYVYGKASQDSDKIIECKNIFKYFIKMFRSILDTNSSDTQQITVAIKGYGYFAKCCKLFLKSEDVKFMFTEIMQRSEQIYLSQGELKEDRVNQLPNYIAALSYIIEELDELTDGFCFSLERLTIILFENFPKFNKGARYVCCQSIVKLLFDISSKGSVLKHLLSQIVYHGLIRTCSHPVVIEQDMDMDYETGMIPSKTNISYKDFLYLWENLLDKQYSSMSAVKSEKHQALHEMIYNELIEAILRIIHKLDLTSHKGDESNIQSQSDQDSSAQSKAISSSDPVAGLQPRVHKDVLILINLVEFCKAILPRCRISSFEQWIYVFGRDIIIMSSRFPVISGFYKLLQVCMKLCKDLKYFKDIKSESQKTTDDMDIEFQDFSDCTNCFILFRKFTKEVLVRMKQFKDDLLSSCLELVLSLPHEIVVMEISQIVPALKQTFHLGLSYPPLAQVGLDTLESWIRNLRDVLAPHFKDILPCFDGYLKSISETGEQKASDENKKTVTMTSRTTRGRKISVKLLNSSKGEDETKDGLLVKIRHQMLHLLGSLGGCVNMCLLGTDNAVDPACVVAWDTVNHLSFAVPFQDMKPTIYLDPFLPRVVELATTSCDRQTKVAACELLHSLVLFILGKGVTQPGGNSKSPMEKLWKKIIPAVLRLACDVEMVAKQLFQPLVSQLIHWFTNNRKYESPETMALLEALLDGVVHPTDTALRDFTAQWLCEFVRWSIKQTTQTNLSKSPYNIKSLLKRLYSLASHPSSSKRLGAALAFNNIYTVFREESSLVDIFVLEILVNYLESLAMAHGDEQAQGTQEQCKQVIAHLERIIKVKAASLNKENPRRRVPRGLKGVEDSGNCVTLSHMLPWLIKQCGKPQTECRHQCMRLVCQIAPLLPGTASASFWMKETHKERPSYFVYRFEGGGGGKNGILAFPTLKDMGCAFSLKDALLWYGFLLASLDCYTWALGEQLLSPKDVFDGSLPDSKYTSKLFTSLQHFLSDLAMFGIQAASDCFESTSQGDQGNNIFSPKEIDKYNRAKCTVIVRTMNFLTVLLQAHAQEALKYVPAEFWSEHFFNTLLSCILEPAAVGFNVGDVEVIENLPDQTKGVCIALKNWLPSTSLSLFKDCLVRKLSLGSHCNLLEQLPIPLSGCEEYNIDHLHLTHLVNGYQQLLEAGLLIDALKAQSHDDKLSAKTCGTRIFKSVYSSIQTASMSNTDNILLTPASQQLALKLLEFSLLLGLQDGTLEMCILESPSSADKSEFGITFYRTFSSVLNIYFVKNKSNISSLVKLCTKHSKLVCTILNAIMEQVQQEKTLRGRYASSTVACVLKSWSSILNLWTSSNSIDLKYSLLELLRKVLVLDSNFLSEARSSGFEAVLKMYSSLLTDKSFPLAFKSRGLELLPYFTRMPENHLSSLKSALDTMVATCFPLRSDEFIVGSPNYNDYISAFDKILTALISSGSLLLLKLLTSIMCREEVHIYEDEIQSALVAFITRLHPSPFQAKQAIDVCFEVFVNERDHLNQTRRSAAMRMCVPLLCQTSKKTLLDFFSFHIKTIMGIVEAKALKPSDPVFEDQLISKLCCFKLIEVLYTRLNKEEINNPQSVINRAYCVDAKTGKELTMAITKCAHSVKSENMCGETVLLDLRRQLHCYAYNALAALISCTQTDQKFYTGFLFTENTIKGQFLLDNLVDCQRKYEFETVLSAPITRKKQMMAIRTDSKSHNREEFSSSGRSLHYMSSQYLADSSLSEEVSQFDFSTPIQAFAATDITDAAPVEKQENTKEEEEARESVEETVEMDELNQHECMGKLCAIIKHLSKDGPSSDKEMPAWMKAMHSKFTNYDTHVNVKLFITKVIINEAMIFQPFAKFWLTPLMKMVDEMFGNEGPLSRGINYFIVDVLVTLLFWSSTAIPENTDSARYLTSGLLKTVMTRTQHENRAVFRNNLEIVKTMVEVWKDRIEVPTSVIQEGFSGEDPSKNDNATGIQLLGVVLANNLSPFQSSHYTDEKSFYAKLINNLSFKYKEVHAAAAEVIGMMLKQLANNGKLADSPLEDMVSSKLQSFVTSNAVDTTKYITCVHKLQLHFPPIVDKFMNRILFILPTVHGSFKTLCLEIILSRVGHTSNIFQELKSKGLKDMLGFRDEEMHVVLLKIIHGLLEKLSMNDLQYIMPSITAMSTSSSVVCRELLYDILIWIYDMYRNDQMFREEEGAEEVLASAKDYLLQGLIDKNKELRLKMQNFWSDETRLPNTTLERLVDVLSAMYSPNTESQYLSYTTNLILHLTSVSPDFNRLIFEQPLSECKFEDYPIDYSWHQRNASMTPLFIATQGSIATGMSQSQGGSMMAGMVRATQSRVFTPTQDMEKSQTFDWLNPSSQVDGQPVRPSFVVGTSETQSSLLFVKTPDLKRKYKQVPRDFGSKRLGTTQSSTQSDPQDSNEQQEILKLKRRFLKNDTISRNFFAKREMMRKKMREEIKSRQQASRDSHVVMYRKYRVGDLPDIQIKHSELIAPLQAVAQNDSNIAKLLFSSLVQAIFKEAEQEGVDSVRDIQSALTNMAESSTQYFAPFVSSIQGICFNLSKLSMKPSLVSISSLTSLQQPVGIMLLERQLLTNVDDGAKKPKRARLESRTDSGNTETWLELAKMYRSIGEYDVVQGIFSDHIGTQAITKKALECEARGDYAQALKYYNQAMACEEWTNGKPVQEEEDLWDDARLKCFDQLSQWENLEKFSLINIDDNDPPDLDKVWSDTFYQEHYLPFLIRSKLKQCCEGGDTTVLGQFMNRASQFEERQAFIESRHSEDLALLHILNSDYDRARYYVANCLQGFLMDWAGLDSMMVGSRLAKLQSLQTITEMKEFLDFVANEDNFSSALPLKQLFEKWLSRFPDRKFHPISVWDDVITNRCVFMQKILDRFDSTSQWSESLDSQDGSSGLKNVENQVRRQNVLFHLEIAEAAKEQLNFPVSTKHLRQALKVIMEDLKDESLHLKWTHAYTCMQHKKSHTLAATESVETAITTIGELEKFSDNRELLRNPAMALRHHLLKSRTYDIVYTAIESEGDHVIGSLDDVHRQQLSTLCGNAESSEQIVSQLMIRSFTSLQNAIKTAKGIEEQNGQSSSSMVEAMMVMVKFCDSVLRKREDDLENAPQIDVKLFPGIVVRYVLKAMTYCSEEAQRRFPRLLQLVEIYPDTLNPFVKKASIVPCWMFIGWINQIVALMDKKEGPAVHNILHQLATHYPQALCFPFKISSEQFSFENSKVGKANKEAVTRLRSLLENQLLDDFIAALEQLQNPQHAFKDWYDEMKLRFDEVQKTGDGSLVVKCYKDMYKRLLDHKAAQRSARESRTQSGVELGAYRVKLAQKIASDFEKCFGSDGSKLLAMKAKNFDDIYRGIKRKIDNLKLPEPRGTLKEFSPWLNNFQSSNYTQKLEIPGQYTGRSKPLPEYHVKIDSFDERVLTMTSVRRPKRIIIRGDDEKEYMFLVKGGEDLRLDQRIEQLFCAMNDTLNADPACKKRNLRLRTYEVIPMTPRVGLIEWMTNTKPLKSVLEGEMTSTELQQFKKLIQMHDSWIEKYCSSSTPKTFKGKYGAMYSKASRTETETDFLKKQGQVPGDILRRAFSKLAASPEAFLTLRSHFARTHACLCICNYLVGIGDRHLSNLMIDTVTGGMVGIDFGHAFGSATQFLPAPELMPFRLTRQIVNLLLPLKESGLLRSTMIHTLRALRENHELLLNTMDVFVKEPSLDWKVNAQKQAASQGIRKEDEKDSAWYPKEKVNTAKKKFLGANPAFITRDDIRLGHGDRGKEFEGMKAVCLGDKKVNIRARVPENGLTVETQVDCLIDQATDPNLLGRTYAGWEPWV